jgi:hypothetical protein
MKEITKELAPIKSQISKVISSANSLEIKNRDGLNNAVDILSKVKRIGNTIKAKKESIIKPINESLKSIRELFRPLEDEWSEAEMIIKEKMNVFNELEEEKARIKEAKITEKVESGKMSMEKAANQLEEIQPEKKIESKNGSVQFKTYRDVIIEDESKLPYKYLVPDRVRIRRDALSGVIIEGVKVVEKKQIAVSSK